MSDIGKLALLITLGAALNVIPTIQKGKDPVPTLAGNVVLFLSLAAIGGLWRYDVVKGFAGLYLLSSFLIRGIPLVDSVTKVLQSFGNTVGK